MFKTIPSTYDEIKDWRWSDYKPYSDQLLTHDLTEDTVDLWLTGYTQLNLLIDETEQRTYVATTQDTNDEDANQRFTIYNDEILPEVMKVRNQLDKKLVESGFVPAGMEIPIRDMKGDLELFREANLPLISKEKNLFTEYDRVIGAQTVEWDGEEVTLNQLTPVFTELDRTRREQAWRLSFERRLEDHDTLNNIWTRFLDIRKAIAKNADMSDYRAYKWKEMRRFDYTPDDALAFFDAIEETVVPVVERLHEKRRIQLGLDSLRPWDISVDTQGRDPLRPFDDVQILKDKSVDIFNTIDPKLGDYVRIMSDEGFLDLDNRKGKGPGGYMTYFPLSKRPFIFMNSVGLHDDVQTMLHESGHAFHGFYGAELTHFQQYESPIEFAEVASMAMELLASPYLSEENGGFYTPADAARARIEHLSELPYLWAYIAVVASFQHWVYTHIEDAYDPEKCDEQWEILWNRFMKGIDYTSLEKYKRFRWRNQLHIYLDPFYYIEYGLAQLGAVQVWANSLDNHEQALADYRAALKLGNTATLPELFKTAGAKLSFDAETLGNAVTLIEKTISELEAIE
jgi:oligoendopeptidase F